MKIEETVVEGAEKVIPPVVEVDGHALPTFPTFPTFSEEFEKLNTKLDTLVTEMSKHRGAIQAAVAALARLVGVK